MFSKLDHFSIVFRSRALAFIEVIFGKTLVWNDDLNKYEIQVLSGRQRKVNQRWTPYDSLSMLMHPQLGNFEFAVLKEKIQKCLDWLDGEDGKAALYKDRKRQFLHGLQNILIDFNKDDREYNNAIEYFCKSIASLCSDNNASNLQWLARKADLFKMLYKDTSGLINSIQEDEQNLCGLLNNSTVTEQYWEKLKDINLPYLNDQSIEILKQFAINVLNFEKNQSALERIFALLTRKEFGRNRLKDTQLLNEEELRSIMKQWSIFDECKYMAKGLDRFKLEATSKEEKDESDEEDESEVTSKAFEIGTVKVTTPMLYFDEGDSSDEDCELLSDTLSQMAKKALNDEQSENEDEADSHEHR